MNTDIKPTQVTKWKSVDGKLFDTEEGARIHGTVLHVLKTIPVSSSATVYEALSHLVRRFDLIPRPA